MTASTRVPLMEDEVPLGKAAIWADSGRGERIAGPFVYDTIEAAMLDMPQLMMDVTKGCQVVYLNYKSPDGMTIDAFRLQYLNRYVRHDSAEVSWADRAVWRVIRGIEWLGEKIWGRKQRCKTSTIRTSSSSSPARAKTAASSAPGIGS